jgi:pyridoxamine 5'-phosphate oxidase family protein
MFSDAEIAYLLTQQLGRIATVQRGGTLQVSPVCYTFDPRSGRFDIAGIDMAASQKFRNVAGNGRAAFVVDDLASTNPWRVRCVEVRGRAEAITASTAPGDRHDGAAIRIHPEQIISFGIGDDRDPHELVVHNRKRHFG